MANRANLPFPTNKDGERVHRVGLTDRELATVLASLRLYQGVSNGESMIETLATIGDAEIDTDGGEFDSLTAHEIGALAERLNTGG